MPESTSPVDENKTDAPVVLSYMSPPAGSATTVVWCRLLALCMLGWGIQTSVAGLVEAIDFLPRSALDLRTGAIYFVILIMPAGVWLTLAWYCWAKAPSLADRIARDQTEILSPHGMRADELLATMMIGIGIYLLAEGLPTFARLIYESLERARGGTAPANWFSGATVGAIVRCSLGLWLILGTRGILAIIRRHSGRWRDPPEPVALDKSRAASEE